MRLLVLNGPNLNLLGTRQPDIYGHTTYAELCSFINAACDEIGMECDIVQTNHEGELVDAIQAARGVHDGIIINPAAYTHTSIAILDALQAVGIPAAEVHISNIKKREPFRTLSYAGMACKLHYIGEGIQGYKSAVHGLHALLRKTDTLLEEGAK